MCLEKTARYLLGKITNREAKNVWKLIQLPEVKMIINAALHFSVHVKSKQEAFSPQLLEWCLQRPITVIRGIAQACDIDLGLYTTKTLAQTNPNHPVEVRTQLEQNSDENWAPDLSEEVGN